MLKQLDGSKFVMVKSNKSELRVGNYHASGAAASGADFMLWQWKKSQEVGLGPSQSPVTSYADKPVYDTL